jgi:hypothetical protein
VGAQHARHYLGVLYDEQSIVHHLAVAQGRIDQAMSAHTELMADMIAVPAGRILEWSPADGWEPLCAFLERPVPAAPLPRVNDSASFNAMVIAGAMEKLTGWWSRQPDPSRPDPSRPGPASAIA